MAKKIVHPKCACGCGIDVQPRADGKYATYGAPGHDARHKSALIKSVLDEDENAVASLEVLTARNWLPFLEKSRATRAKKEAKASKPAHRKDPARVSALPDARDEHGLTARDLNLLEYPPTNKTWYCVELHGHAEDDPERILPNSGPDCWFCHTKRPDNAPLVWPLFEDALERLGQVDMERVIEIARYDTMGDTLNWKQRGEAPDDLLLARKVAWLHRKWLGGGTDDTTPEEAPDGEEINQAA